MAKARTSVEVVLFIVFALLVVTGNMVIWLAVFVVGLLTAALFGRYFCGYICPMNTLMRVSEKVAKRMNWQRDTIPTWLRNPNMPWFVLALMISTVIVFRQILQREFPFLLILLVLSFIMTLRLKPWVFHNLVCPYGALLRLTGKYARFAVSVKATGCVRCQKCEEVCPANAVTVTPLTEVAEIDATLCHQCADCIAACPTAVISYQYRKR
ncbi:MAG: 4Fe-4S binding protein [Selenomonadales bacterium]|jgi:polyferredoxin|nr:4Fe-4S binding protein [Selenomonadales bacterium]